MNVFVKPCLIDDNPALVRDPASGKRLAAGGEWKTKSQFWVRRIMQGDVIDETKEQTERQKAPAPAVKQQPSPSVDPFVEKKADAAPFANAAADKSK